MSETPPARWSDALLDSMRAVGDPRADAAVAAVFAGGDADDVNRLFRALVRNDDIVGAQLPAALRGYPAEIVDGLPPWMDAAKVARAQELFGRHGLPIVTALFFASLPSCYAHGDGVQVLALTARLETDARRRVIETAQFLLDVMAPGGLGVGGSGVRDAQKVRLMHAAVRHLVARSGRWDPAWATPISQEDLGGTLLTFSIIVIDALPRVGVHLSDEDGEAWLHTWNVVGRLLGVDDRMLARDLDDARLLAQHILARGWRACAEGQTMQRALLDLCRDLIPGTTFDGFPSVMTRRLVGDRVADLLAVPPADWTNVLARGLGAVTKSVAAVVDDSDVVAALVARFTRQALEGLTRIERGGERAPFAIPTSLRERWGTTPA